MKIQFPLFIVTLVALWGCDPNVVSSAVDSGSPQKMEQTDAGGPDAGAPDAGANPYPKGPYGVTVNRTIENFSFPGFFATGSGVKVNSSPELPAVDLQAIRNAVDEEGKPFRYLLLDISAGWCPPCNQEAKDLGLKGSKKGKVAEWLKKGGLFMVVLEQGYDQSTGEPATANDAQTWINQHSAQTSVFYDPGQALLAQGINPSAFPTNLVIDLSTMRIVSAWYGLDDTYQKWEAALNAQ